MTAYLGHSGYEVDNCWCSMMYEWMLCMGYCYLDVFMIVFKGSLIIIVIDAYL